MLNYRAYLDTFALMSVSKAPNIHDYHLMVGSAEDLSPLPILVAQNATVPNSVVENMAKVNNMTNEQIEQAIANNQLEVNDMNWNTATIGSPLGGV